ncbi:hypothetical protein F5884DRAFT_251104 [Xylogone sp. PMI_703]|nr:hypothetical protein F5884DRAFT_251104 [Xylogone sp. PMI_703]
MKIVPWISFCLDGGSQRGDWPRMLILAGLCKGLTILQCCDKLRVWQCHGAAARWLKEPLGTTYPARLFPYLNRCCNTRRESKASIPRLQLGTKSKFFMFLAVQSSTEGYCNFAQKRIVTKNSIFLRRTCIVIKFPLSWRIRQSLYAPITGEVHQSVRTCTRATRWALSNPVRGGRESDTQGPSQPRRDVRDWMADSERKLSQVQYSTVPLSRNVYSATHAVLRAS